MRFQAKRIGLAVALLGMLAGTASASIATFDDVVPNSGATDVPLSWDYAGLNFSSTFFQGVWGDDLEEGAHDGTPVFINGYDTEVVSLTGGGPFTLNSFDLGLSFYTLPADTVTVTFNFAAGGSTSFDLLLAQSFQTVAGPGAEITSFSITTPLDGQGYIALDNISFNSVPEPSSAVLLSAGAAGAFGLIRARRRRTPTTA